MSEKASPVLKSADMALEEQEFVFSLVSKALEEYTVEREIASFLKKEMDTKFGNTWHCIVGKNFGSYVTHEMGHFIYFYVGNLAFLLFKTS